MDFSLTAEQTATREQIIRFAQQELSPGARARDRDQVFSRELWNKCADIGLTGLPIPEAYGGSGLDPLSTALALEAFGYGCEDSGLVFSVSAHLLACTIPVWKHGSDELKDRYLNDLAAGRKIAVNGMTEPHGGSDAFSMKTTARKTPEGFELNGTKIFGSNAPVADLAIVYAANDRDKGFMGGITAFVVENGTPGFAKGQSFEKMGLRTSPIGELVFDGALVPSENVIGHVGAGGPIFNQSMEWERICLVAAHLGVMERLLHRAIAFAKERKSFGRPIGKNQAISHKIADMKLRLETARLLVYRSATKLNRSSSVGMDAAMAKLYTSEALVRSALEVVQVLGGYGYMTEYDVERSLRDAVGATIYSGTSEMQRNIIAEWLGL